METNDIINNSDTMPLIPNNSMAVGQYGEKNIVIGQATNVSNIINVLMPYNTQTKSAPDTGIHDAIVLSYYHLFVIEGKSVQ